MPHPSELDFINDSLEQATPATVSRCGMIWFSADTVSSEMCLQHLMGELRTDNIAGDSNLSGDAVPPSQISFLDAIQTLVVSVDPRSTSLVLDALHFSLSKTHIMDMSREGLLKSLKSLLVKGIEMAIEYDENHPDFPMSGEHIDNFAKRWLLHSLLWSFAASASWNIRSELADLLLRSSGMMLPSDDSTMSLADYRVRVDNGELELWSDSVPRIEIESHKVTATDVVVTTTDTVRHSDILGAWLESRSPLILCGPPGSGKTMTLTSVLQSVQGIVLANLNFSSRSTPEIIMKTFAQVRSKWMQTHTSALRAQHPHPLHSIASMSEKGKTQCWSPQRALELAVGWWYFATKSTCRKKIPTEHNESLCS